MSMNTHSIEQLFDLSGKTAIVTGAAQGIGLAIAVRLAEARAQVMLAGHNAASLEASAREIRAHGGTADWVAADVTILDDLDKTIEKTMSVFGAIDILVNCAGGAHPFTPALELTEEIWDRTLDRNLKGSFFLSQKAAREMIKGGKGGRIINIASIAGIRPDPQLADYNASKAALLSLTQSLASEFGRQGVLVNAIAPGPVMSPNSAAFYEMPDIQAIIRQRTPLERVGQPEDIANAVLFFAGSAAKHVNGSILAVDGGMLTC